MFLYGVHFLPPESFASAQNNMCFVAADLKVYIWENVKTEIMPTHLVPFCGATSARCRPHTSSTEDQTKVSEDYLLEHGSISMVSMADHGQYMDAGVSWSPIFARNGDCYPASLSHNIDGNGHAWRSRGSCLLISSGGGD